MKKGIFTVLSLILVLPLFAQAEATEPNESNFSMGMEIQTKYIWRGQEYANGPTMIPSISYNYKGFSIGAIGAYDLHGDYSELDLFLSYTINGITISLTDYYYPNAVGLKDNYFNFKNSETGHMYEGTISYEHEKIPVWILASTFFTGADKNPDGKQAWSSYAEIGTHYDFLNNNSISLALGTALNKSFYNNFENSFSIINIALKYTRTLILSESLSLPLSSSYVINPHMNKGYINFSAALTF